MSNSELTILLTNDDGYQSPGLEAMQDELSAIAKVYIVAPEKNCSGMGGALSLGRKLPPLVWRGANLWSLDATPADCAYVGIHGDGFTEIDLLIAGPNFGDNLSTDIFSSGTIGAAVQGRHLKYPPIAVSLATKVKDPKFAHFETAAKATKDFVEFLLVTKKHWKEGLLWNINVPDKRPDLVKNVVFTRQAERGPSGKCINFGGGQFAIGCRGEVCEWADIHSDVAAIEMDAVSVTPLNMNLTMSEPRKELFGG